MSTGIQHAILAGLLFGAWPLLMNRSGLNGNISSAVFCLSSLLIVLPFAFRDVYDSYANAHWGFAVAAGFTAGIGILLFNGILSKVVPEEIATYYLVMIMVQIAVPAAYQIVLTHNVSGSRIIGIFAALTAAFFLSRG